MIMLKQLKWEWNGIKPDIARLKPLHHEFVYLLREIDNSLNLKPIHNKRTR